MTNAHPDVWGINFPNNQVRMADRVRLWMPQFRFRCSSSYVCAGSTSPILYAGVQADDFARNGFQVYIPDYLNGDPPTEAMVSDPNVCHSWPM